MGYLNGLPAQFSNDPSPHSPFVCHYHYSHITLHVRYPAPPETPGSCSLQAHQIRNRVAWCPLLPCCQCYTWQALLQCYAVHTVGHTRRGVKSSSGGPSGWLMKESPHRTQRSSSLMANVAPPTMQDHCHKAPFPRHSESCAVKLTLPCPELLWA